MKLKAISLVCMSALFLGGCASKVVDITAPSEPLEHADIMPTAAQMTGKNKVVIFEVDDSKVAQAKSISLGYTLSAELEKHVAETGSEVVDRNLAKQLEKELQLAEMHGKSNYDGPKVADYAVNGKVSTATFRSSFTERKTWQGNDGKYYSSPAKCTFTASVSGNFKIYKMIPKLTYMDTVEIDDTYTTTQETRNSACPKSKSEIEGLISQAGKASVKDARIKFQNLFAPKAYILEKKQNEDRFIFKLSTGTESGFKGDSDLMIYSSQISTHPITGEESIEEIALVEGTMSATIGTNYAWIIVDDPIAANRIRLGDYVKVQYSKTFFNDGLGALKSLIP